MFEHRRERYLLAIVASLLALVLIDRVGFQPMWRYATSAGAEIDDLRAAIEASHVAAEQARQVRPRVAATDQMLWGAGEQQQNEFRQYLESLVSPDATVTGSKRLDEASLADEPGLVRVSYELRLSGQQAELMRVLERFEAVPEALRIESLRLGRVAADTPVLSLEMVVSTIAHAGATGRLRTTPARPVTTAVANRHDRELEHKNIFFPTGRLPEAPLADRYRAADAFVVAGMVAGRGDRAVLLEVPSSGTSLWVRPGERLAGVEIVSVEPDSVVVRQGSLEARLSVGQGSADLPAIDGSVLRGPFELVGVVTGGRENFALVRGRGEEASRRVRQGDRIGEATVASVGAEGMVLDTSAGRAVLPVGAHWPDGARRDMEASGG